MQTLALDEIPASSRDPLTLRLATFSTRNSLARAFEFKVTAIMKFLQHDESRAR